MAKAKLSESDWQRQVIDLAQRYGWLCAHFRPARTARGWRTAVQGDGAGFPDLVLVRGARLIIAELKTDTGRLSVSQKRWLERLRAVGGDGDLEYIEVCLWRPRDFNAVHDALRPDQ